MMRLEWVSSDGTRDSEQPSQTGSEDCWVVIHGHEDLEWYQLDAHKVGWIIAGVFGLIATIISGILIVKHLKNYTVPRQQRHIVRIILIIPIYSIISFLSYRFYREAPYYTAVRDCYEAFALAAFYMLMLQYIGDSTAEQKRSMLSKRGLKWPFPMNCFRMNPAGRRTFILLKWGIMQYVIISPTNTLITIITHAEGVYCPNSMKPKFAHFWVSIIDFISITVAMYSLITLYQVIKEDIKQNKPLIKFLAIKAIVFFTFWEGFVISWLGSSNIGVIKETKYWTKDNVVEGLTSLIICIEMVLFSILFVKAFPVTPYLRPEGTVRTSTKRAFMDSLNFMDFIYEIWYELKWLVAPITKKYPEEPDTEKGRFGRMDIVGATRFNVDKQQPEKFGSNNNMFMYNDNQMNRDDIPLAEVNHPGTRNTMDSLDNEEFVTGNYRAEPYPSQTLDNQFGNNSNFIQPPQTIHVVPQGHYQPPPNKP